MCRFGEAFGGTESVVGFVELTDQGVAAWQGVETDSSDF